MEMAHETQWILIQSFVMKDLEIESIPEMTKDYTFDGPEYYLSRTFHTSFAPCLSHCISSMIQDQAPQH